MRQLHLFYTISARSSSATAFPGSCRHRGAIWSLPASRIVARNVSSGYDCHHQSLPLRNLAPRPWTATLQRQLGYCRQLSFSSVLGEAKEPLAGPVAAVQTTVSNSEHYSQNALDSLETSAYSKWAADAAMQASELPAQGDFTSLGLGGYSPIGLIQWSLEYLHVHAHLPWWLAIVASTLVLRTLLLPIAIHAQANAAKLNNIRPETEKLMAKVQQYKQAGNQVLATQHMAKVYELYRKHDCHPGKMFLMPAMQVPLFISFFIGIRRMATVPVESMKDGGILWFTDLTSPDPFFVLPFLACLSFMAIMEVSQCLSHSQAFLLSHSQAFLLSHSQAILWSHSQAFLLSHSQAILLSHSQAFLLSSFRLLIQQCRKAWYSLSCINVYPGK